MKASKSTILKAIKAKCMDCCGFERKEVTKCTVKTCPIYDFRLGNTEMVVTEKTKSKTRKPMSDEHKAALKAGREAAKAKKDNNGKK